MNVQHTVAELIEAVGKAYRAIDIRAVATREADSWVNAMAVVRLTYEDVDTAKARIANLAQRHRPVETKLLRIVAGVRSFTEWDALCSEVHSKGVWGVGNLELALRQRPDLSDAHAYLQSGYSEMRPFDGRDWPTLKIKFDLGGTTPLIEERFNREVNLIGYEDVFEAANALCELNVAHGQNHGCDFSLSVPVFATVSGVRVKRLEKRVCVEIERHNGFSDLSAVVCLRGQNAFAGQPFREQIAIPAFSTTEMEAQIAAADGSGQFNDLHVNDWVQVRLLHPLVGEIKRFENSARMLIPPAERNILLEALRLFCEDSELEDLLVRAYNMKAPRLNESAAFELHVAWLLGLFGLSTVVLGDYEHIVAPGTRVQRTSVDILAASQRAKWLIAVACTLNPPKAEDFANLRYAREILAREVFRETEVRVLPVLFTAGTGCPSYDGIEGSFDYIPIVDADQMKKLLRLLRVGQEVRFFQFLANPIHEKLPDFSES